MPFPPARQLLFGRLAMQVDDRMPEVEKPQSRTVVQLPHNASCIEMADVRAAAARCPSSRVPTLWPDGDGVLCPRSLERVKCVAPLPPVTCPEETHRVHSSLLPWSRMAIGMATYPSDSERELLQAAASTWLQHMPGVNQVEPRFQLSSSRLTTLRRLDLADLPWLDST